MAPETSLATFKALGVQVKKCVIKTKTTKTNQKTDKNAVLDTLSATFLIVNSLLTLYQMR